MDGGSWGEEGTVHRALAEQIQNLKVTKHQTVTDAAQQLTRLIRRHDVADRHGIYLWMVPKYRKGKKNREKERQANAAQQDRPQELSSVS